MEFRRIRDFLCSEAAVFGQLQIRRWGWCPVVPEHWVYPCHCGLSKTQEMMNLWNNIMMIFMTLEFQSYNTIFHTIIPMSIKKYYNIIISYHINYNMPHQCQSGIHHIFHIISPAFRGFLMAFWVPLPGLCDGHPHWSSSIYQGALATFFGQLGYWYIIVGLIWYLSHIYII